MSWVCIGVWPPGRGLLPPKPWSGKGRRPKLQRRDAEHQPVSAKDLAVTLPPRAWQTVSWRAGSRGDLSGRFATVRVRPSHRDYWRAEPYPEEWLLIEWPAGDKEPSKYWLSTQPSPHFSYSEINALPLNGQQAVTAISALWLRRSTAFRWLQQPIGRHLMIDVVYLGQKAGQV